MRDLSNLIPPHPLSRRPLEVSAISSWISVSVLKGGIRGLPLGVKAQNSTGTAFEVVARQQHAAPEHTIVLDIPPLEQVVPILADAGRIKHVREGVARFFCV